MNAESQSVQEPSIYYPRQPDEFYLRLRAAFENRLEGFTKAQLLAAHGGFVVAALESLDTLDLLKPHQVPERTKFSSSGLKKTPRSKRGAVVSIQK